MPLGPCAIPPCICPFRPLPRISPRPIFPRSRAASGWPVSAAEASALEGSVDGGCERGAIEAGRKPNVFSLFVLFEAGGSSSPVRPGHGVEDDSEPLCCWCFRRCFPHLLRGLELLVDDWGRVSGADSTEAIIAAEVEERCCGKWARISETVKCHKCTVQSVTEMNSIGT